MFTTTILTHRVCRKNITQVYLAKKLELDKFIKVKQGVYSVSDAMEDEIYYMLKISSNY